MKATARRVFGHPPEMVFAALTDPSAAIWGHDTTVEGQGLGARYRSTARIGPHEVITEAVVTHWDPPHRLAWRTQHEAMQHEADLRVRPHRRGTEVVQVDRETWHHAPWWARMIGQTQVRRELQRRLAALEQQLG